MKSNSNHEAAVLPISTRDGRFVARYSVKGLAGLEFPQKRSKIVFTSRSSLPMTIRRWHRTTEIALKRILSGRSARLLPPLDLSSGTQFQQRVWNALLKIPRGKTNSYGEIARTAGNVRAARAVGAACGVNPIPVLIPCHRVLAADQKLGGFSAGLNWKRLLLWREESREWWQKDEKPPE